MTKILEMEFSNALFCHTLDFCIPGKNFDFIFNTESFEYEWLSDSFEEVLGYSKKDFDILSVFGDIHFSNIAARMALENAIQSIIDLKGMNWLLNHKIVFDLKVKHKLNHYVRLLIRMIYIYDEETNDLKRYGNAADISHIKKEGVSTLNVIGLNKDDSLLNIPLSATHSNNPFTKREKEIVSLVIHGFSNKETAEKLFISLDTVKNHKRNIFEKIGCRNSIQLFKHCVKSGWSEFYVDSFAEEK